MVRRFVDSRGATWEVSETGYYGFGPVGEAVANKAWVHFTSGARVVKLEAPRGIIPTMSETELAQTLEWLLAKEEVLEKHRPMREYRDADGTEWLITEEGLPAAKAGHKGTLGLRFISPKGVRYLVPTPEFWSAVADSYLKDFFERAKDRQGEQ